jgi:hypothetical protein
MEIFNRGSSSLRSGPQPSPEPEPTAPRPCEEFEICEIQLFYSKILGLLAKLGFALLLITFALYFFGVLGNYVPRELLPQYWSQPLPRYLKLTGMKTGWAWLGELHHGDFLTLLPIAFLAGTSIICILTLAIKFFRNREPFQGLIAALEIAVLLLAASGILKVGGH